MFQFFCGKLPVAQQKNEPHLLYFCDSGSTSSFLPRTMHRHNNYLEILYIASGSGLYFIGDREYAVKMGDVLVINPNTLHDERENSNSKMKVYCCGVSGIMLPGLSENCLLPTGASPIIHTGALKSHIVNILSCMYEQVAKNKEKAEDVCMPLLTALIALIRQVTMVDDGQTNYSKEFYLADRIKVCLDDNCFENYSLESMARSLCMSVSCMSHTFKYATGYSPVQYMIRRRIGEAQTLLITTKHPVTQVSTMVGYDNTNYFSTLFSKIVGLPPKDYRNRWVAV